MKAWSDLVAASLIGTGRASLPSLSGGTPALEGLLRDLDARPAERQLLAEAAAVSLWQRAGALAPTVVLSVPGAAPPDDRRDCSPASGSHLERLLSDPTLTPVLPEWLTALQAAERYLPHHLLPEMLDLAANSAELRPLVLPVLGPRGAWLAAQNSDWAGLLVLTDREAIRERWVSGIFADRLYLLRDVRRTDPAFGRELVTSTWEQDPPREREAFMLGLAVNLSLDDEPLAEAALDDRRKEVRAAAVDVAAALPGSRLCRRMTQRVLPLLQFQPGEKPGLRNLGRGEQAAIGVVLPEVCDKGMQRDGVEPKPGQRARLGAVPLETWTQAWRATPAELVSVAADGDWSEPLWIGWQAAALRYRDVAWAAALIEAALAFAARLLGTNTAEARSVVQQARIMIEQLWPVLPYERQEALILQAFRSENQALHDQHPAAFLLALTPHIWSDTLGRTTLRSLQARIRMSGGSNDWQVRSYFKQYARSMPPSLAAEAAEGWERQTGWWSFWASVVDEFLTVLQFRHEMHAALSGPPPAAS